MKRLNITGFKSPDPDPNHPPVWNENVILAGPMSPPKELFKRKDK